MKKVYLFPLSTRASYGVINPYITHLRDALNTNFEVLNAHKPSKTGIFDVLKYLRKVDVVYFNWGEEVPENSLGRIQGIFLLLLVSYLKRASIQIIWTLHNKKSHYKKYRVLKEMIYNQMLKKSDLIITHAREGLELIPPGKIASFQHHPVNRRLEAGDQPTDLSYDIIIWGTIYPYKGIHTFLRSLEQKGIIEKYRILIAGKIVTRDLASELQDFHNKYDNLELRAGYIEESMLVKLVRASRITLFTYHSDSILSSGVLMDSLSYGARIVGPSVGAFNDLQELGLIDTYTDFSSLISTVDQILSSADENIPRQIKLEEFMAANSWEAYSQTLLKLIK